MLPQVHLIKPRVRSSSDEALKPPQPKCLKLLSFNSTPLNSSIRCTTLVPGPPAVANAAAVNTTALKAAAGSRPPVELTKMGGFWAQETEELSPIGGGGQRATLATPIAGFMGSPWNLYRLYEGPRGRSVKNLRRQMSLTLFSGFGFFCSLLMSGRDVPNTLRSQIFSTSKPVESFWRRQKIERSFEE